MIAGDQVLPRITSNVSLSLSEPEADPLGGAGQEPERRVRLEHLVLGRAEHGQLVEVVHHHAGVPPRPIGG